MYRDDHEAALLRVSNLERENAELKERLTERERRDRKLFWRVLGRDTKRYAPLIITSIAALGALVWYASTDDASMVPIGNANLSDAGVPPPPVPDRDPPFAFLCTTSETEFIYPCRNAQPMTRVFWSDAHGFCTLHLYWDVSLAPPTFIPTTIGIGN
jgi:hypothetical protein